MSVPWVTPVGVELTWLPIEWEGFSKEPSTSQHYALYSIAGSRARTLESEAYSEAKLFLFDGIGKDTHCVELPREFVDLCKK